MEFEHQPEQQPNHNNLLTFLAKRIAVIQLREPNNNLAYVNILFVRLSLYPAKDFITINP